MDETSIVFNQAQDDALDAGPPNGSGIPVGFDFHTKDWQAYRGYKDAVWIFPPGGGLICLYKDGTWEGDGAPFAG